MEQVGSGVRQLGNGHERIAQSASEAWARDIAAIAAERDREAFARLFQDLAPKVKGYLLALRVAPDVAEEIAQDTLLTVWRKADAFDPTRASAATWVFTIARNLRVDRFRRDRHPDELDYPAFLEDGPPLSPEASVAVQQREAAVREALHGMPLPQRELLRLFFFDDRPHSEIAEAMSIPLGTVKSRLRLAVSHLRKVLERFE